MPAGIDQERLNEFQSRMSRWISSQGLLFQIRHASGVRGAGSGILASLVALLIRLFLVGSVVAACFWLFLMKRVEFGWFRTDLSENVAEAVGADVVEVGGMGTERGSLLIGKMTLEGGEDAFYYAAEMRGVRTKMQLLDGVTRGWNGEEINAEQLQIRLKGGAESDEKAAAAFGSLFCDTGQFRFAKVTVVDANLAWGYSAANRGMILNSAMEARRADGGWDIVFTGGTFSQNWLRRLDIERIEAKVRPDSFEITEARLKRGSGTVRFTATIGGGAVPKIDASGTFGSLQLEDFLDPEFREYINGNLSGEFTVTGSTNSQDGLQLAAGIKLADDDTIELYDRISVFRAISAVDRLRSYKKVRFNGGSFGLETGAGVLRVKNIALDAPEILRLEGHLLVRPPTEEEIAGSLNVDQRNTIGLINSAAENDDGSDKLTLRKAGDGDPEKDEEEKPSSIILSKQFGLGGLEGIEDDARLRKMREPQVEGLLRLGVTEEAFSRSTRLSNLYPLDEATGLRWLELPLKGSIYNLGVNLAEELYNQSRADR